MKGKNNFFRIFLLVFLFVFFSVPFSGIFALSYQEVELGGTIRIGEFIYEDDYTPSTADCTITVYDPSGTLKVNGITMTEDANGWHYYDYAVGGGETIGNWPAFISCGTINVDLIKIDKTFTVISASSLATDVAAIKAVTDTIDWTDVDAILTDTSVINWSDVTGIVTTTGQIKAKTDDIDWTDVDAILTDTSVINWSDVTGIKTNTDTIAWGDITNIGLDTTAIKAVTDTIDWADIAAIPLNVWGYTTRTLTSFGTLVADIWSYSTRTLTSSAPPQVIIMSMGNLVVPDITANVRITNEGYATFEYQYEWCVVTDFDNECGGGDDVDYASAAKLIGPGENFDTVLSATVPTPGNYYFKIAVFYGIEKSGASRSFVATAGGGGGGGGSGGGNIPPGGGVCNGADFNHDSKVNSVDFSILLSFWKTNPPFSNTCVDINRDSKVNAVDFSILLSQWGTNGISF
jgi:hypothetical protein